MDDSDISKVVKEVAPFMVGFEAKKKALVNNNGMIFQFYSSWNGKTTISGLGAKRSHQIGCSFKKEPRKIAKDIYKRLYDDYRDDFLLYKKEESFRSEKVNKDMEKLAAICSMIEGAKVVDNYGNYKKYNQHVCSKQIEVNQDYQDKYDFKINLSFGQVMNLIKLLKENKLLKGE